jgi:hypothetical protein
MVGNTEVLLTKPPEMDALYMCYNSLTPIVIVISRTSALLPCQLPESCEFAILGYFKISIFQVRISFDITVSLLTIWQIQKESKPDLSLPIQYHIWRLKLEWQIGGEPVIQKSPTIIVPWWRDIHFSYPDNLQVKVLKGLRNMKEGTLWIDFPNYLHSSLLPDEVQKADCGVGSGWHCSFCGKLSLRGWMRRRENCPSCVSISYS